jgi:UDP-glucose 4-epimerase
MLTAAAHHGAEPGAHVYNLGRDETITVRQSIDNITDKLGVTPEIETSGGDRGWVGDSPLIHLDTSKIAALGWEPSLTIRDATIRTLEWFEANPAIALDQEPISS